MLALAGPTLLQAKKTRSEVIKIDTPLYPHIWGGTWWQMFGTDKRSRSVIVRLAGTVG